MEKIKYDSDLMKIISIFESATGARLKDAISSEGSLMLIVQEGDMGRAIGKNGSNIRKMENLLKKKIKVAEFSGEISKFAANLMMPLHAKNIEVSEGIVSIYCNDTKTRAMLIGRDRSNINFITGILRRYFEVKEVKVL